MCRENNWGNCRLDGSISMKKRQKMCDDFNDPSTSLVAFLLSSKAGGCGLNLIGGNRLVLFDPDWNPAVDKQAAARCWRDGQKKRCFTYRFMATGTVEEKIFQRQLSKEGLQSVVDDKEQVNALSTKDLRNLFTLRQGTPSDTHDKLKCERCKTIADDDEAEAAKILPKKIALCRELLEQLLKKEDSELFLTPLKPDVHGVTLEEYQRLVKQPMDFGTVRNKLDKKNNSTGYPSPAAFSKDVNRVFSNVLKVWEHESALSDAALRLQCWWVQQWTELVPKLMLMKSDSNDVEKENSEPENGGADNEIVAAAGHLNERGEDFQDQIGMPDEENMRSWSHHHSTDTVDDPIFRAAMRGYDAVSFVFGLEVTWSLIQQRQQEEEERQAMEALEVLENMEQPEEARGETEPVEDKEESHDNDKQEEENYDINAAPEESLVNSGGEDPVIMETESGSVRNDEEPMVEEQEANLEKDKEDSHDSEENERLEDPEITDLKVDKSDLEEQEFTINNVSTSDDTMLEGMKLKVIVGGELVSNSPETDTAPVERSPASSLTSESDGWVCRGCTFANPERARKCKMCCAKKI